MLDGRLGTTAPPPQSHQSAIQNSTVSRSDRFLLALAVAALLVSAGWLLRGALTFDEIFTPLREEGSGPRSTAIQDVPTGRLADVAAKIRQPDGWKPVLIGGSGGNGRRQPLFVSVPQIAKPTIDPYTGVIHEQLIDPETSPEKIHDPIPNRWFLEHHLRDSLLAGDALTQDPDGDGFTNLEEFLGRTDPTDRGSHPPYVSKLFLERFVQRPFRLRFAARNGPVVQINALDVPNAPSQFLRVGQTLPGTKFKVVDLRIQSGRNELGSDVDTSVVTLENTETRERLDLPKERDVDSPDPFAVLRYTWGEGRSLQLKKNQEFSLKPEENVRYRLVDVNPQEATLQRLTDNQTLKVPPLPTAAAGGDGAAPRK